MNIYRNTSLYDGKHHPANGEAAPEWTGILKELRTVFDRYIDAPSTEQLEAAGLDLFVAIPEEASGCATTAGDPSLRMLELRLRREISLTSTFLNVYQPKSPLSDMWIPFAAALIRLLQDSQIRRPDVELVRCGSWLNSVLPFQKLFPERWKQSAEPRPEVPIYHGTLGPVYRSTRRFPCPERCAIPADRGFSICQLAVRMSYRGGSRPSEGQLPRRSKVFCRDVNLDLQGINREELQ